MVVNALLNGIADTFAQGLAAARPRAAPSAATAAAAKRDGVSIEIHELGEKPLPSHHRRLAAAPFDVDRLVRYMTWGMAALPACRHPF